EDEIAAGDSDFAQERLKLIAEVPRLYVTEEVASLAEEFYKRLHLPERAKADAAHLALACHYEIDYLLTWNLTHLANAHVERLLARMRRTSEMAIPIICTPEQLMQWSDKP